MFLLEKIIYQLDDKLDAEATVNKKGWFSTKKAGNAKIYVKSGKKKATVNVKVMK